MTMPRRRERIGPRRVRRDESEIDDLFVTIDKSVAARARKVAALKNVHVWEVVEDALRSQLPDESEIELADPTLLEVPQASRRAS
ncbi:Uncharacterised protein [Nocardia africana]|uniref:Uncharacterized protein n=1 Tax=Nocardia africana TaxID=134964 RepID=A0A379X5F2_9NOCA|nr:Uncharacterised protein [Nocardia africana]